MNFSSSTVDIILSTKNVFANVTCVAYSGVSFECEKGGESDEPNVQFKRYISLGLITYHPLGRFLPEHVSIFCNRYLGHLGASFELFIAAFIVVLFPEQN